MTISELAKAGHFYRPSNYKFKCGQEKAGMISIYFPEEQENFYFVPIDQVHNFTVLWMDQSYEEMKKHCEKVNIHEIVDAKHILQ